MNWSNVGWKDNSEGQGQAYRDETRDETRERKERNMKNNKINRSDINANSLSAHGSYKTDDGETVVTQLAETNYGKWAVRAYTEHSGTVTYRGPFETGRSGSGCGRARKRMARVRRMNGTTKGTP